MNIEQYKSEIIDKQSNSQKRLNELQEMMATINPEEFNSIYYLIQTQERVVNHENDLLLEQMKILGIDIA